MLTKLLKHDLTYTFKLVSIYSLCLILSAVLTRLTYDQTIIFMQILHMIFYNCVFIFAINLIFSTILRLLARLKTNFYSDQGYLTHTLPVRIQTLWLAKFLNSCLAIATSVLVVAGSFWLAFASFGRHELIFLDFLASESFGSIFLWIMQILLALILQFLFIIQAGSIGIISGYAKNSHHPAWSVFFGLLTYALGNILLVVLLIIYSSFNPSVSFFSETIDPVTMPDFLRQALILIGCGYAALIVTTYFIGRKILQNGINLD